MAIQTASLAINPLLVVAPARDAVPFAVFERLPRHRRDAEGLGSFAFLYHGTVASRAEALFSAFRLVTMV
jgi:hypothetical protein